LKRFSANRYGRAANRQEFVHLGRSLKLLDPGDDDVALLAARRSRKFALQPKPLRIKALLECVGLRTFPRHRESSVVASPGCWPSDRSAR
jgi:uncharacterized protein (DUF1684 family)